METKKKRTKKKAAAPKAGMTALKDFEIYHPTSENVYQRKIKKGEDLSDVPAIYHENLKTEGVIERG